MCTICSTLGAVVATTSVGNTPTEAVPKVCVGSSLPENLVRQVERDGFLVST